MGSAADDGGGAALKSEYVSRRMGGDGYSRQMPTAVKDMGTHVGDAMRDGDAVQGRTPEKHPITDFRYTVGNHDALEALALRKGIVIDAHHTVGQRDAGEMGAVYECVVADIGYAVGDVERPQTCATAESTLANAGHARGDGDADQIGTRAERAILNAGYAMVNSFASCSRVFVMENCLTANDSGFAVTENIIIKHSFCRNEYRFQAGAIFKCTAANKTNAVGNGDAGERCAILKRTLSNAHDAVGNGNAG